MNSSKLQVFLSLFFLSSFLSLCTGVKQKIVSVAGRHRGFGHCLIQETARINFNLAGSLLGQLLWLPVQGSDLDYNAQSMGLGNFTQSKQEIETRSSSINTNAYLDSHLTYLTFFLFPCFKFKIFTATCAFVECPFKL